MNAKRRTKPEIEQLIFGEFVEVCPLGITGFDSRPEPEPDILAKTDSGAAIAFELTRNEGEAEIQKDHEERELTEMLGAARDDLNEPEKFLGHYVRVNFYKCGFREKRKLIPDVIRILNEHGPIKRHAIQRGKELICSIQCFDLGSDIPPYIAVSSATPTTDYTLETFKAKLKKRYETPHPIHLLIWSDTTWLPEMWRNEFRELFENQTLFRRVWVFDRSQKTIVFDSGE
jgi:hypothetical protein